MGGLQLGHPQRLGLRLGSQMERVKGRWATQAGLDIFPSPNAFLCVGCRDNGQSVMIPEALKVSEGPLLPAPGLFESLFPSFPSPQLGTGAGTHTAGSHQIRASVAAPHRAGLVFHVLLRSAEVDPQELMPGVHHLLPWTLTQNQEHASQSPGTKLERSPFTQISREGDWLPFPATSPNSRDSLSQEGLPLG